MMYTQEEFIKELQKISESIDRTLCISNSTTVRCYKNTSILGTRKAVISNTKISKPSNHVVTLVATKKAPHVATFVTKSIRHTPKRSSLPSRHTATTPNSIYKAQLSEQLAINKELNNNLMAIKDEIGILTEKLMTHDSKASDNFDLIVNTMGSEFQKRKRENIKLFESLSELQELSETKDIDSIHKWLANNALTIISFLLSIYKDFISPLM